MTISSDDKKKLENTKLSKIKSLIDSFNVENEKFVNDKYYAEFNVQFNKKNTLKFFENKNIFPSIPKTIDILIIPILIHNDNGRLAIFNENPIYKNWNKTLNQSHLLNYILPNEDIEDRSFLIKNLNSIEDYDFKEIIEKYDLENFIINIVFKDEDKIKVLSKILLNNDFKVINKIYKDVDVNNEQSLDNFIQKIKTTYEDSWKNLNIINTSIKLPITVSISSKEDDKIILFEKLLNNLDLISYFYITSFNNKNIYYKIIYNGSPKKFLDEVENYGLSIVKDNKNWKIQ